MADFFAGVPSRVRERALRSGDLHDECLEGPAEDACPWCEGTVMEAFEVEYGGSLSLDEVIGRIVHDMASDLAKEETC